MIVEVDTTGNTGGTSQTLFGMAQVMVPPIAAVASTTHPGSVNNCHNQPLMTLR